MDGNRRWAKEQGLESLAGHARGQEVFQDFVGFVRDAGIPHAVFYAFSTENWQRKEEEVGYLMVLFSKVMEELLEKAEEGRVGVRFIGQRKDFSPELQFSMAKVEEKTAVYKDTTIWIALSYGGRAEILNAVNKAIRNGQELSEEGFSSLLWTAEMPDPDMIVRTSGEQRLSNFLTWSSVYSEFFFIDKHWPALTKSDFDGILGEYEKRERRKGV